MSFPPTIVHTRLCQVSYRRSNLLSSSLVHHLLSVSPIKRSSSELSQQPRVGDSALAQEAV